MTSRRALLATPGLLLARGAAAQADPARLVVNFTAGGSLDGTARLLAEQAARDGRGTVVVENRPAPAATSAPPRSPAPGRTGAPC
ncbi:hypothetical protein [Falsiroseomonas sp. HW251]|uniref:hypothetical protein n=1 Tax=Falsiroseomonas sp. HW251 TaxID=3390998 RepID=UPI003D311AA4